MMNTKLKILLLVMLSSITGCASFPNPVVRGKCFDEKSGTAKKFCRSTNWVDYERGNIFCPYRYQITPDNAQEKNAIRLAKKGYLYALGAALELQKEKSQDTNDHHFELPENMINVKELHTSLRNGFQASTFEIKEDGTENPVILIAFRGSDQIIDWRTQNIGIEIQNNDARDYVKKIYNKYKRPVIVSGFSLGGGLSAHVKQHPETKNMVKEAWLFNPSPFDGIWGTKPDKDTYVLYQKGEVLTFIRKIFRTEYADTDNTAYYRNIKSFPVYSHFRYSLMLQILHAADTSYWCEAPDDKISPTLKLITKPSDGTPSMTACDSAMQTKSIADSKKFSIDAINTNFSNLKKICPK